MRAKTVENSSATMTDNGQEDPVHDFVGESKPIREVKKLICLAGPSRMPVLILGETGTGK